MSIRFYCQCCGARFRVPTRQAGRKGHCYRCGHPSRVPDPEQLALYQPWARRRRRRRRKSSAERDAETLPHPAPGDGPRAEPTPHEPAEVGGATTLSEWLKAATLSVGLDSLSLDQVAVDPGAAKRSASAFDFEADSRPYPVAAADREVASGSRPAGVLVRVWRRELNLVRRLFRWLHEGAFLASIPFLIILAYGVVERSRTVALLGATFVVALNAGRALAGASGLAALLLLDGFRLDRMRRPLQRVLDPLLIIAAIILLFTFVPWLAGSPLPAGSIVERLDAGARKISGEMTDVLGETIQKAGEIAPPGLPGVDPPPGSP